MSAGFCSLLLAAEAPPLLSHRPPTCHLHLTCTLPEAEAEAEVALESVEAGAEAVESM
jgi:hypothetical protein